MNLSMRASNNRVARALYFFGGITLLILAAGWARPDDPAAVLMAKLGVKSGELVTIAPVSKSEMAITMDGQDYMIDYAFVSNRAKNFKLMVQTENGEITEQDAPVVSTIRGRLRGIEGSRVVGCVTEDECCAKITFATGESRYIQPVNRFTDDIVLAGLHLVYSEDQVIVPEGRCGTATNLAVAAREVAQNRSTAPAATGLRVCELALEADFEYFTLYGSVRNTLAQMELVINVVNDQFESEASIRHTINEVVVRTAADDPFTSSDTVELLEELQQFYTVGDGAGMLSSDLCYLFTARRLDGGIIGAAFLDSVCDPIYGFAVSRDLRLLFLTTDVVAHELGHNWSLQHCDCPAHTMNPFNTGANDFNDTISVPNLIAFRDTLTCLDSVNATDNDDWNNTVSLAAPDFATTGSNFNATTQRDEQNLVSVGSTVWWSVDFDSSGRITIDTFGSDFDTQLHVYEFVPDGGFAGLQLVDGGANDDANGLQSAVTIDVTAGKRYEIRVGGSRSLTSIGEGSAGNIVLNGDFTEALIGDVNQNGTVGFDDIAPFISLLIANDFQVEADCNEDGELNFFDISAFIAILQM